MFPVARRIEVEIVGNASSLEKAFGRAQSGSSGLSRAFGKLALAAGAGIVGAFGLSVKAALDFDRSMRNVNSIAKLSERQFQSMSKQVLKMARETGQAPKTLADGMYDIVSSGFKANDAIKVLRASAKAATAGMTDTATASKAVAAALNAYHLNASQARKVSDVLFQTVNKGVLTFEELSQNMGDLVPAAAPLGVRLEEVGAAMATLTLQGVPAAEAATRVKSTMVQLAKPSEALSKLLKAQGFESGEAAIKARGFAGVLELLNEATKGSVTRTAALTPEIRSLLGVVGLTGKNLATYRDNLLSMEQASDGAGATAAAFAEQGKSIAFQWQKAKAALTAAAIPIGQLLFPLLAKGASAVETFAAKVESNMPAIRQQFGQLATVAGTASASMLQFAVSAEGMSVIVGATTTFALAKAAAGIAGLVTTLGVAAGPVGLAAAGIGLLAGGALYLYLKSREASEGLRELLGAAAGLDKGLRAGQQARLDYASSITTQKAAQLEVTRALRERAAAEKEGGTGSERYRVAQVGVERALQARQQAEIDTERAQERTRAAQEATKKSGDKLVASLQKIAHETQRGEKNMLGVKGAMLSATDAQRRFASEAGPLVDMLARGQTKASAFAKATVALAVALGRLPTRKEVNIIVTEQRRSSRLARNRAPGEASGATRAFGGFIPAPTGEPMLIEAHGGEIILNPRQQEVLGGPRYLAELFGFRGEQGPSFAAGGRVPKPTAKQKLAAKKKAAAAAQDKARKKKERERKAREAAAAKHAGRVSADLPASIEEAIVLAEDTPDRADDIAAYVRAEKLLTTRLGRARTAAERVPIRRALQDVRKQLVELRKPPDVEEDEEAGGPEETDAARAAREAQEAAEESRREAELSNLKAQLDQATRRTSVERLRAQLSEAMLGAGGGGAGAPQIVLQSLVAPTDEMVRHAARVVTEGIGGQGYRTPTSESLGV